MHRAVPGGAWVSELRQRDGVGRGVPGAVRGLQAAAATAARAGRSGLLHGLPVRGLRAAAHRQECALCNNAACTKTLWPPARLCSTPFCEAFNQSNLCTDAGCEWQDDGGVDVEWPEGSGQTVKVPKCGISTASATEAEQRCGPPPEPACNTTTNWWDLYDDTGQEWGGEHVGGAECDQSVCPYPYGASTCMPHPFVCCDRLSRTCSVWDGKVRRTATPLPLGWCRRGCWSCSSVAQCSLVLARRVVRSRALTRTGTWDGMRRSSARRTAGATGSSQ